MIRSQAIKLLGVEDRFTETGHVVVEVGGAYPEVVMFNGDPFIAVGDRPATPDRAVRLQYRKVCPYRFVWRVLP
ncbi:hypothetical protein [Bradyrhizobium sp. USDA 3458]|uniref:hypothetical protein n=1 Tax=Bradyrhizobium sp. USDA 3458 TaxID=2591461 RepID=UPI00114166F5|nr:hypothetical protein [Bradyrhizobium sp. USDA 3458]